MASSPESSPPSPSISSPPPRPLSVDNSASPPHSTSPPPESSSSASTPEESKLSPTPSSSSSSPPPLASPTLPPSSSTSSSSSSSPPPAAATPTPTPTPTPSSSSSTPPSPQPLSNNATTTNPTPSSPSLSPSLPPPSKLTSKSGLSTISSTPRPSPLPPKSRSSATQIENASESDTPSPSTTLTIIICFSIIAVLFLILISMIINLTCNRKKKNSKFDNHIQCHDNPMPRKGGVGYGNANNGYQANDHLVINLPAPHGGNAGHGGWPKTPSPQGQTPDLSSSDETSSNLPGKSLPPAYPLGLKQSYFTYEELAVATQGFCQENLLGQGGFGFVHKGVLPNGKEVAVKSLKSGSGQGQREFRAEVEIISRIHHRHLVSLVGYSMAGDKKMLVYEFLPNKTLEFHLHEKGLQTMDWPTRLKIALGAAKGLAYLHEDCHPRIIHRDIKSANILIDFSFEAMVADFGLAKLTQDNNTHVSTRVMGTFGYLAPEYASSGKLTEKSDVFSFGIVLLELITGRRPLDLTSDMDESLVDWARPLCARAMEDGNFSQLVDPRLENNFVPHEMASLVSCAGACIKHSARRRPKVRQIVRALEDGVPLDILNNAVRSLSQSSRSNSRSDSSFDYDSSSYSADCRRE